MLLWNRNDSSFRNENLIRHRSFHYPSQVVKDTADFWKVGIDSFHPLNGITGKLCKIIAFSTGPYKRAPLSDRKGAFEHFQPKKLAIIGLKGGIIAFQPIILKIIHELEVDDDYEPDWEELMADFNKNISKAIIRILCATSLWRFLEFLTVRVLPIQSADKYMKDPSLSALRKLTRMSSSEAFFKITRTYIKSVILCNCSYLLVDEVILVYRYFKFQKMQRKRDRQSKIQVRSYAVNIFPFARSLNNAKETHPITKGEVYKRTLQNIGFFLISPFASGIGFAAFTMILPNYVLFGQAGALVGEGVASLCF